MPWSRNTLWRQGSVLSNSNFQAAGLTNPPDFDLAIAISHDCDIANDKITNGTYVEPGVEFVFARIIEKQDGNNTYGKNPRILHLDYIHEGKSTVIELVATEKVIVFKNILETFEPDENHDLNSSRQVLQIWLAARYRRHALPNSLVDRLKDFLTYVDKQGKQHSAGILSFRVKYEPKEELTSDEPYEFWLNIIYCTDNIDYGSVAEKMASDLKQKFSDKVLKANAGKVDLRQCEAFSESEFTIRRMRETEEYRLEYLSYRTDPPEPSISG
jgi:hypothetical protein